MILWRGDNHAIRIMKESDSCINLTGTSHMRLTPCASQVVAWQVFSKSQESLRIRVGRSQPVEPSLLINDYVNSDHMTFKRRRRRNKLVSYSYGRKSYVLGTKRGTHQWMLFVVLSIPYLRHFNWWLCLDCQEDRLHSRTSMSTTPIFDSYTPRPD